MTEFDFQGLQKMRSESGIWMLNQRKGTRMRALSTHQKRRLAGKSAESHAPGWIVLLPNCNWITGKGHAHPNMGCTNHLLQGRANGKNNLKVQTGNVELCNIPFQNNKEGAGKYSVIRTLFRLVLLQDPEPQLSQ